MVPAPRPSSLPRATGLAMSLVLALSGCALLPEDVAPALAVEAPEVCGFPEGTVLEYAGRSTTALLGVNEIQGDPMSFEPADIYVTRDAFDQGELHGRLVCAIYVTHGGFVETTVHPADDPFVPPTPAPPGTQPADGVDQQQAVEAARARLDDPHEWTLGSVAAGSVARLVFDWESQDWTIALDAEDWVWRISFSRDDEGVEVFVDYIDGTVLGETRWILN
jgi:hypothetical protein